jgi:hypothetical protein
VFGDVLVDGQKAQAGTPISATSKIETAVNSWAKITLMQESVIAIRAQTKLILGSSEEKQWSVRLALGAIWSLLPKGASYEVVTSNVVAGVRGTTLFVAAPAEGQSGVCACDGEVELVAGGKTKVVKSKHAHIGTMIAGSGSKAKLGAQKKSKKPPGHDDVEGAQLEKLRQSLVR